MKKFTIKLSENEVKNFINLLNNFSKMLDLFKKLEEDIKADKSFNKMENKIYRIYENFEHIGQRLFHFIDKKFPKKLVSDNWQLKMIKKYLKRQGFPE